MTEYAGTFFDILILAALAAAIYRSWQLSQQFSRMQADRQAFEQLISALNIAASRAELAVRTLKEAAGAAGDQMQEKINAARALADEMEIMIQAGDNLAERLNALATTSRKQATPPDTADSADSAPAKPAVQPRTKAEKELLDALKAKQQS